MGRLDWGCPAFHTVDFEGFGGSKFRALRDQIYTTEALKSIAWGKLTVDERVVVHLEVRRSRVRRCSSFEESRNWESPWLGVRSLFFARASKSNYISAVSCHRTKNRAKGNSLAHKHRKVSQLRSTHSVHSSTIPRSVRMRTAPLVACMQLFW